MTNEEILFIETSNIYFLDLLIHLFSETDDMLKIFA